MSRPGHPLGEAARGSADPAPPPPVNDSKRKAAVVSDSDSEIERPDWLKALDTNKNKVKKLKSSSSTRQVVQPAVPAAIVPVGSGRNDVAVPTILVPTIPHEHKKSKKSHKDRKEKKSKRRRRSPSSSASASEGSNSSMSHCAESVFRDATNTKTSSSQDNLRKYALKYPGRLACATMQSWDKAVKRTGQIYKYQKMQMPPSAKTFYLIALKPKEGDKVSGRLREIEVLSHVMDHLATGEVAQAADIITQRMHACKLADEDNSWHRAQYAELILPDSINMVSKEMRQMTDREEAAQRRLARPAPAPPQETPLPKAAAAEDPWIMKKGNKTYVKGWILQPPQGKGGKPDNGKGKKNGNKGGKNKKWDW